MAPTICNRLAVISSESINEAILQLIMLLTYRSFSLQRFPILLDRHFRIFDRLAVSDECRI